MHGLAQRLLADLCCAEFVQNDQRVLVSVLEDSDDIGNVTGKSGKRLFNRLLVADISEYIFEKTDLRTGLDGKVQAGLCHQSQQPMVFRVTVFPPVFGPVMINA